MQILTCSSNDLNIILRPESYKVQLGRILRKMLKNIFAQEKIQQFEIL